MSMTSLNNQVESLDLFTLRAAYLAGSITPIQVVQEALVRIRDRSSSDEWTYLVDEEALISRAEQLAKLDRNLPFYGIPFSVKDNINVAGLPTTAGCQAYQRFPEETSPLVAEILAGGGILMGKNTMDAFATGVVGVRSNPHPVNPFNSDYIPGGSSSGSGVVVSKQCVTFALGSDTGGSGRVPAALCNIVGFKPTPSALSNIGMVYANKSIDCVPIFSLSAREAEYIFTQIVSDTLPLSEPQPLSFNGLKVAVPDTNGLKFFGDRLAEQEFLNVVEQLQDLGCVIDYIDFTSFSQAGNLLFEGGLLSERHHSVGKFIENNRGQVDPVVESIILSGADIAPNTIWNDLHAIKNHTEIAHQVLAQYDFLLTPTAGTLYRVAEVYADPIELNKRMAYYTNFSNLLNLSVIAMPARIREDGLPFGISLTLLPHQDQKLLTLARLWEQISGVEPGCGPFDPTQQQTAA